MKKLFLLLALFPTMLWADGSGSLFVNNNNGLTNNTKKFYYLGATYTAKQMAGDKNCYYFMNNSTNTKYLFMDNASIRFIQGTKSMTDLVIVLRGLSKIECGNHSCIGLEKGNLTIDSEDGNFGQLEITQTGDYRCIYTSNGGIEFTNSSVVCVTYNSNKACVSQESKSKMITFRDCYFKAYQKIADKTDTWIYAKGGIRTVGCGFSIDYTRLRYNASDGYLYFNGKRYRDPQVNRDSRNGYQNHMDTRRDYDKQTWQEKKEKLPQGYRLGDIDSYLTGPSHSAVFTVNGRQQTIYMLSSTHDTKVRNVGYCPALKAFVLCNDSQIDLSKDDTDFMKVFNVAGDLNIYVIGKATILINHEKVPAFLAKGNLNITGQSSSVYPKASLYIRSRTSEHVADIQFRQNATFNNISVITINDTDIKHLRLVYNATDNGGNNTMQINNSSVYMYDTKNINLVKK